MKSREKIRENYQAIRGWRILPGRVGVEIGAVDVSRGEDVQVDVIINL